jgi:uncharacterized phage-associated protein
MDRTAVKDVILRVLQHYRGPIHRTKLVKLVYLIDYLFYQHYGRTLTGLAYGWDHYGPNAISNAIVREASGLTRSRAVYMSKRPNPYGELSSMYKIAPAASVRPLSAEAEQVVEAVLARYGAMKVPQIVNASKRTKPFEQARQHELLHMKQMAPAGSSTSEEFQAHQRELEEHGTISLEQLRAELGIA